MLSTQSPPDDLVRVLVVHVNHAVATAVAHRLLDGAVISLARPAGALETLRGPSPYDAVVLCPYLGARELESLLAACRERVPEPAVVQISDAGAAPAVIRPAGGDLAFSPANRLLCGLTGSLT